MTATNPNLSMRMKTMSKAFVIRKEFFAFVTGKYTYNKKELAQLYYLTEQYLDSILHKDVLDIVREDVQFMCNVMFVDNFIVANAIRETFSLLTQNQNMTYVREMFPEPYKKTPKTRAKKSPG